MSAYILVCMSACMGAYILVYECMGPYILVYECMGVWIGFSICLFVCVCVCACVCVYDLFWMFCVFWGQVRMRKMKFWPGDECSLFLPSFTKLIDVIGFCLEITSFRKPVFPTYCMTYYWKYVRFGVNSQDFLSFIVSQR